MEEQLRVTQAPHCQCNMAEHITPEGEVAWDGLFTHCQYHASVEKLRAALRSLLFEVKRARSFQHPFELTGQINRANEVLREVDEYMKRSLR